MLKSVLIGILIPFLAFGDAVIFSGNDVQTLKPNIDLFKQAKILSGTVDPTSSATSAPIGSIYLNKTNGKTYKKLDSGSTTSWVELGQREPNKNFLSNSGFEVDLTDWTGSGVTPTRTTTDGERYSGYGAMSIDASSNTDTVTTSSYSIDGVRGGLSLNPIYGACQFKYSSSVGTYLLQLRSAGITLAEKTISAGTSKFDEDGLIAVGPTSGNSISMRIVAVASNEPKILVDDCYLGTAFGTKIESVSQAQVYGTARLPGTSSCVWTKTSNDTNSFSADSDCTLPSGANLTGKATAAATKIPAVVFTNNPAGFYKVSTYFQGQRTSGTNDQCTWFVKSSVADADGVTLSGEGGQWYDSTNTLRSATSPSHTFRYTTAQATLQFEIVVAASGGVSCALSNSTSTAGYGIQFTVEYFPLGSDLALSASNQKSPTVQIFTSGSGTYTRPAGAVLLRVRMAGGGGGGSGSGTATGGTGGTGNNTTFGTSLLTANGGSAGVWSASVSGAGGGFTVNSPAINFGSFTGGSGTSGNYKELSTVQPIGGDGGANPFGGGGAGGGPGTGGNAGTANTGAGGGGGGAGGVPNATAYYAGNGGGAGGYVEAQIPNPDSSYSYSVGGTSSGGTAGSNGTAGGGGAAGIIIVEEYYSFAQVPLILGTVVAPQFNGTTYINNITSVSADYTALTTDETIMVDSSGANRTITLPPAANVKGKKFTIQPTSNSNRVIIDPNSSELVCNVSTISLFGVRDAIEIQSTGTEWQSADCDVTHRAEVRYSGGAPAVFAQDGNWISSVSDTGTGQATPQLKDSAVFSTAPACVCSNAETTANGAYCLISGTSTTQVQLRFRDAGGTLIDENFHLVCKGGR